MGHRLLIPGRNCLVTSGRNRRTVAIVYCNSNYFFSTTDISDGNVAESRTGQKRIVANLWREFFSDPLQWWDHRSEKANPRYPDFKHKKTRESLWLNGKFNPSWVEARLGTIPKGTLQKTIFSWNISLSRHNKAGEYEKTLHLFRQMQEEGIIPDKFTFVPVLNACASLQAIQVGKDIHIQIISRGLDSDIFVGNSLVDMYGKCGNTEAAWKVFSKMPVHNVVSWNAMIMAYVKCGQAWNGLELYQQMHQEGINPDSITFVGVLNACGSVAALREGRRVHRQIIQSGCLADIFVCSCLTDMYAKCGSIEEAECVFNSIPTCDVFAWNAMILGYVKCGEGKKALKLFGEMCQLSVDPDHVTFVAVLNACAGLTRMEEGRHVHHQIIQRGWQSDVVLANSLVNMYAKCGSIKDAQNVFNKMPRRSIVSWTAMLGGYAMLGCNGDVLRHFKQMCDAGIEMNAITFLSLLSACSHRGLVSEGLHYFESMSSVYNISPSVDHCASIIDLLGRAGRLHEAENQIKTMLSNPNASIWMSLLGACRVHGNVEMGEWVSNEVRELEPENAAAYVLLWNIYAAAGKWDSCAAVNQEMLERGFKKHQDFTESG